MESNNETLESLRRFGNFVLIEWTINSKTPWALADGLGIVQGRGETKQGVIDLVIEKIRKQLLGECGLV